MKKIKFLVLPIIMAFMVVSCEKDSQDMELNKTTSPVLSELGKGSTIVTLREPGDFSAGWFGCWGKNYCYREVVEPNRGYVDFIKEKLTIVFDKINFSKENIEYYSKNDIHEITENIYLPKEDLQSLGLLEGSFVKVGKYALQENTKDRMVVTYDLHIQKFEKKALSRNSTIVTIREPGDFSAGWFGCWGKNYCYREVVQPNHGHVDFESSKLTIIFNKINFSEENKQYFTENNSHEITEEMYLLERDLESLNLREGSFVKPGEYQIIENNEEIMIVEYDLYIVR